MQQHITLLKHELQQLNNIYGDVCLYFLCYLDQKGEHEERPHHIYRDGANVALLVPFWPYCHMDFIIGIPSNYIPIYIRGPTIHVIHLRIHIANISIVGCHGIGDWRLAIGN